MTLHKFITPWKVITFHGVMNHFPWCNEFMEWFYTTESDKLWCRIYGVKSLHHGLWNFIVYTCTETQKFKNEVIFALRPTVLLIKPVFRFLHQNTSICTPKWSGWSGDFKETILDRFWSHFGPILVDFDRFLPQNAHQNDWDKVGIISKTILIRFWTDFDEFWWILTNFWCTY